MGKQQALKTTEAPNGATFAGVQIDLHGYHLDCSDWGRTTVKLKRNAKPTRTALDLSLLPPQTQPL